MPEMPSGTVTFLFTDIEGSTKLWEAHPEAMRSSLARHDTLMREAIGSSGGYVFKTIGDAFCAAFATASDAVHAVLAAQLSLAAEPWPDETPIRVRMALHTGAVESRDDDYFGPPVNRVARLLSTAHGGQSVLSQPTYELVRDALPPQSSLKNLGAHQLKDLARPEQVYQLVHPLLRAEFPPIRSLSTHPNNLPQQLTSFIGRERETEDIKSLMAKSRLVTLLGSGGTGKTRLSLQVAADLLESFPDGTWFVELAPLSDPSLVARTLADVISVKEQAGEPVMATLLRFLKDKKLLVVLDNCEHLVESCASLAHEILQKCPDVQVLTSSREALGISGEQTYRVPSLSLPDPTKPQTAESLSHYESVRLFVDRAILARPDFQVTNQNAPALASLCYQLDGIPLAIELAAARVRSLTIEDIDSRLNQRFRLLTGGSRTALPRQQTLKALVDWSYDLLSDAEKALLCRLSVFTGGWSLEAAEAVCAGHPIEDWEVLDYLTSLCDKSLVVADEHDGAIRYRLLETVRQYAGDRLQEAGEQAAYRTRHLQYMRAWTQAMEPKLRGPEQVEALRRMDAERDNVRAALDWSLKTESEDGLWLIGAVWFYWYVRAHVREGRMWADSLLEGAKDEHTKEARTKALIAAGNIAMAQQDTKAWLSMFQQALELSEGIDSPRMLALIHYGLGNALKEVGETERSAHHREIAGELFLQAGDRLGYFKVLLAIAVSQEGPNPQEAFLTYQKALAETTILTDPFSTGLTLGNLGSVSERLGDFLTAKDYHQRALRIRVELEDRAGIAGSLEGVAHVVSATAPDQERATAATRLIAAATRIREETGFGNSQDSTERVAKTTDTLREVLGRDDFDRAWEEGHSQPLSSMVESALGL